MSAATGPTRERIARAASGYPMGDRQDFEDVRRGFVGRSPDRLVRADDGRVVWDLDAYTFLAEEPPETANPSLWRQGRLLIEDGLFEVVPGVYQVRGYDLSVVSFLEGDTGVVVIDPLLTKETAAAALALYRTHRGERPVTGMIYTHSHADHFGGVKGMITQEDVASGRVPVVAPEGFMEHAVSENVFAGTAMARRSGYMYGAALEKGPTGQIGAGLGQTTSTGEVTLIRPTVDVGRTGTELEIDGVRMVFQVTPGTEAPAELNIYLPDHHAVCAAENASHTLHNILTIRGAQVRDAHGWAHYLTETLSLWGDHLDVVFASHHWPTWGRERCVEYLAQQRDLYLYLHDQTLRMINQGYVGSEIAELLRMPPALEAAWHTHGYYGSVSHNVKAIYQRYMGWYEASPARLWKHPPEAAGRRYVEAMGGADAAMKVARRAFDDGDYRWAAEVLEHVVFTDADRADARALQADTFEQLGYGCENGTWRNAYLAGTHELRHGSFGTPVSALASDMVGSLTVSQTFDAVAIRIDGPRAWDERITLYWNITDEDRTYRLELRNGALHHEVVDVVPEGATLFALSRLTLIAVVTGAVALPSAVAAGDVDARGDASGLARLVGLLDEVDPDFAIVTA